MKIADSIIRKLHDHLDGEVKAGRIVKAPEDELRSVRLPGAKAKTIKGLSHAKHSGVLNLENAVTHPGENRTGPAY